MSDGIRCMWMRGGTSKGGYFLRSDLPSDAADRDTLLLSIMGSPDAHQIDGIGGADPLTSKVAILSPPSRSDADVADHQQVSSGMSSDPRHRQDSIGLHPE